MRAVVTSAWREVVRRSVGLREKGVKAVAMVAVSKREAAILMVDKKCRRREDSKNYDLVPWF